MFKCNYKTLRLCFNVFHDVKANDLPEYGDYVLLELKDGRHTAGSWLPSDEYEEKKVISGSSARGKSRCGRVCTSV